MNRLHVSLAAPEAGELTAILPEADFFAAPLEPSATVGVAWDPADQHRLSA